MRDNACGNKNKKLFKTSFYRNKNKIQNKT